MSKRQATRSQSSKQKFSVEMTPWLRAFWISIRKAGTATPGIVDTDQEALEDALSAFCDGVRGQMASLPDPPVDVAFTSLEIREQVLALWPLKRSYKAACELCRVLAYIAGAKDGTHYPTSEVVDELLYRGDKGPLQRFWRLDAWLRRRTPHGRAYNAKYEASAKRKTQRESTEWKAHHAMLQRARRAKAKWEAECESEQDLHEVRKVSDSSLPHHDTEVRPVTPPTVVSIEIH